jgi:hypothetical protein
MMIDAHWSVSEQHRQAHSTRVELMKQIINRSVRSSGCAVQTQAMAGIELVGHHLLLQFVTSQGLIIG